MELRQLEYLVAVAEEANFTRAAQRVHITQSGISAQIRQLERDLGATLIDRSGRRATLTPAGEAAVAHARAALASAGAVRQAVDDVSGLLRGQVSVGMVTACTVTPLFDALAGFHTEFPGVELALSEDTSDRLIEQVGAGEMDLALVGTAGDPPGELGVLTIIREGLAALVPAGHPLARRAKIDLATLAEERLICLPPGTGIRTVLDDACAAGGLHRTMALQATAPDAVVDLAARGMGVGVLSQSMAAGFTDRLTAIAVSGIETQACLSLVWSKRATNRAVRELVERCRAAFRLPPLELVA